jgi:hypothetical protein
MGQVSYDVVDFGTRQEVWLWRPVPDGNSDVLLLLSHLQNFYFLFLVVFLNAHALKKIIMSYLPMNLV